MKSHGKSKLRELGRHHHSATVLAERARVCREAAEALTRTRGYGDEASEAAHARLIEAAETYEGLLEEAQTAD